MKIRSSISDAMVDMMELQAERIRELEAQRDDLQALCRELVEALQKIANSDYRGNRSTESQIAFEALNKARGKL